MMSEYTKWFPIARGRKESNLSVQVNRGLGGNYILWSTPTKQALGPVAHAAE